jgi:hypothetical protein
MPRSLRLWAAFLNLIAMSYVMTLLRLAGEHAQ